MSINWDESAQRVARRHQGQARRARPAASMRSWWLVKKKLSTFFDKHPVIFFVALTFFLLMLSGAVGDYSRACKKEWGSKWENNGPFCAFVRWIDKYEFY
jgi:hypothetical protein